MSTITLKRNLSPTSPIHNQLHHLNLFNTLCGDDDLTSDKDYKHMFKRYRNMLLREKGVVVFGTLITPALLRLHLKANNVAPHRIDSLLNPEDKQDVVLAFSLLKEVWSLPKPTSNNQPAFARCRRALNVLGRLFFNTLIPYIDVSLSISQQLQHLSAAAHLTLALYTHNSTATSAMPVQLYFDIMMMIKNTYFCVAKTKIDDPDGSFWLIQLGTD
ncbi:hypothetical protein FRC02_005698 [Tulasnella sp. 418]|nr:hypothetical protein FRC02_005698 [Tulasnella sp. 418]